MIHGRIATMLPLFTLACVFLLEACHEQPTKQAPPPSEVGTITVKDQEVMLTTELPGRTAAYRIAEVRPQVSGIILKRQFDEGAEVMAGSTLYLIDPSPFQAAYDGAMASLARSQANLQAIRVRAQRYRELLSSGAVSQQSFDDADSAFRQAEADVAYWKAAVESARINLEHTRVTAPISGRTGRSSVTEGALVTASQPSPLVTIQQIDPIYVDIPQSTAELLRLKRRTELGTLDRNGAGRDRVRLNLEDGSAYALEGTLQFQDITVDRMTGSVILRAVFPNPKGVLLPGMFVRAVAVEGVNRRAILIPQHAVSRDPKGNPVALVVNRKGTVEQRQLSIDRAMGNQWLVTSGLVPGDRVIVEGMQKVRPGAQAKAVSTDGVSPMEPAAGKGDTPASPAN
ncbi:MAG TPA: efflux RND transporter periplasmic adaptor subunit [Deltaproteobacteria bacterium]|nr:efflux RND transporter periplasmic adaptor subunit [Deltaproteobacteria bacterium]